MVGRGNLRGPKWRSRCGGGDMFSSVSGIGLMHVGPEALLPPKVSFKSELHIYLV